MWWVWKKVNSKNLNAYNIIWIIFSSTKTTALQKGKKYFHIYATILYDYYAMRISQTQHLQEKWKIWYAIHTHCVILTIGYLTIIKLDSVPVFIMEYLLWFVLVEKNKVSI